MSDVGANVSELQQALPVDRILQQAVRRAGLAQRHIRHKQEVSGLAGQHKKQAGSGRAAMRHDVKQGLRRFRLSPTVEPAW